MKNEPGSNLQYGLDTIITNMWNMDSNKLRNVTFQKMDIKFFVQHYMRNLANGEEINWQYSRLFSRHAIGTLLTENGSWEVCCKGVQDAKVQCKISSACLEQEINA